MIFWGWAFSDFWRWVGFRFWYFVEFCQFVPLPILEFLNFWAGWFMVQLVSSVLLIFIFKKALEWFRLFVWGFLVVL